MLPHIFISCIVFLGILLMLVRPRNIPEVYWVALAAFLLIVLRLVPFSLAIHAVAEGTDVYLFLSGMMLLSELARTHGVFDWLSSIAIRHANGSPVRLFTLVFLIGTLVTVFMSNDATAVVLTPAILAAVRKARTSPLPHLFACALIANAASFVFPISNPANLVVFHQSMPPLGRWLAAFLLPSVLSIASTYLVMRLVFRKDLRGSIVPVTAPGPLSANGRLVLIGLGIMVATLLTASTLNVSLGLATCLAAVSITTVLCIKSRSNPVGLLRAISWSTLLLVAGLFILVDAVQSIGALTYTTAALKYAESLAPTAGAALTAFTVAIANNLVNNLPLGLIAGATLASAHASTLIASAVLIGVDLGPNLSITGSLATILWLIALRAPSASGSQAHPATGTPNKGEQATDAPLNITFWSFLRVGAIAMPVALLCSIAALLLTHLLIP